MTDMSLASPSEAASRAKPKGLNAEIKALAVRDNVTNWYYVGRIWLAIGLTIAGAVWLENEIDAAGLHWAWHIPVILFGLVVIGASQHELGGVLHEATHFMLFADKRLNDIAADWLAGLPMYTSIYHYRLYHLAHHQFINDPLRDPDLAQMRISGHWLDFPVTHIEIVVKLLKQLWLPNLARYTIGRARSHSFNAEHNPYSDPARSGSILPLIVSVLFWVAVPVAMGRAFAVGSPLVALGIPVAAYVAAVVYYALIPASHFPGSRLEPTISHRATAISRVTFAGLLYLSLGVIDMFTGNMSAFRTWEVYWLVPLFTTFPLFMILRHWVHHGNADRGRYTNTRVYLVNPFIRYAIFPFGFEYHLPHHMYASVPHYNLKKLHEILQDDPEYREKCVVVEGYFGGDNPVTGRPTGMSVLGAKWAPKGTEQAFLDSTVLDPAEVSDRSGIERAVEESGKEAESERALAAGA